MGRKNIQIGKCSEQVHQCELPKVAEDAVADKGIFSVIDAVDDDGLLGLLSGVLASADEGVDISAARIGDQITVVVGDRDMAASVSDVKDLLARQVERLGGSDAAIDLLVGSVEALRISDSGQFGVIND